jgi:hypothetical protein
MALLFMGVVHLLQFSIAPSRHLDGVGNEYYVLLNVDWVGGEMPNDFIPAPVSRE